MSDSSTKVLNINTEQLMLNLTRSVIIAMNFSLEQLLAFVAVYDELSFSKAAVKLNKHRTTIGQVVTNLEDQLAVTLFDRIGRSVVPTEDGELLYHYAKQTIERARTLDKVALSLSYGGLENITIAYPSFVPHRVLTDIRIQLAKDFPLMKVNFLVRGKAEIKQGMESGDIHFGIVNSHDSTAMHSVDGVYVGHVEFLPFVKKGGRFSHLSPDKALSELSSARQFVLRTFYEEGIDEKVVLSSEHEVIDQLALAIKFVGEDLGWSLLPKMLEESEYSIDKIEVLQLSQMKEGFKFGVALWSQHSKQVKEVKKSIVKVLDEYVNKTNIS